MSEWLLIHIHKPVLILMILGGINKESSIRQRRAMKISKKNFLAKNCSCSNSFMRKLFFMEIKLQIHEKLEYFCCGIFEYASKLPLNFKIIWNFCVYNPTEIYCWCKCDWKLAFPYLLVWHETKTGELQYHLGIVFLVQFKQVMRSLLFIQPLSEMRFKKNENPCLINNNEAPFLVLVSKSLKWGLQKEELN